jgi:SpoIVB peptidase S55
MRTTTKMSLFLRSVRVAALALLAWVLLPGLFGSQASSARAMTVESLSVDEIRPGMVGEGRTVFQGETIESFKVTILGVLRNYGPDQNMILASLEGGPLAHTGVIAGMSGSPVYIDGKLIGAISYAFPFAKDAIAGITPFQEMVDATDTPSTRRAAARLEFPLTPEKLATVAPRKARSIPIQGVSLSGVDNLGPYLGKLIAPIATPVSVSGFPPESFELVAPLLRQLGMEPLMGGAPTGGPGPEGQSIGKRPVAPGDAIGVALVTGDLQISATGTVTHVDTDSGTVYAFGHPLFNLGPIEYPMTRAEVHVVLPSLMNSFKMASTGDTVGTWVQDRATAIKGVLNVRPRMIPIQVDVHTSRGQKKTYNISIVNDELFSPVLAYASLISILQATERQFGTQTVKVSAWVETTDDRRINIEDIFADQQAAVSASAMVAAPLAFLLTNDFQDVTLRDIRVEVEASEQQQTAKLVRAWLDSDEVSPGGTVALKILLHSYRGDDVLETVDLDIPPYVRSGQVRVTVSDAETLSAFERREARQPFVPKDMDQLVRAINSLRKNNRLYVRLSQVASSGAIVSGEYLSSLPPSVMSVLEGDESSSGFTPLAGSTFWEHEVVTDYSVSGSRVLQLEVTNR